MAKNSARIDPEEKKGERLFIPVTRRLKEDLEALAIKEDVPYSELVREAVENTLEFGRPTVGPEIKEVRSVPITMGIPCGEPDDLEDLIREMGDGEDVKIDGALAALVTPGSFVVRTRGLSMAQDEALDGVFPGDWILMVPLHEFKKDVVHGMIVMAKIRYKNGSIKATLKNYQGKHLKANNPDYSNINFGDDVLWARIWAIGVGRVRQEEIFI